MAAVGLDYSWRVCASCAASEPAKVQIYRETLKIAKPFMPDDLEEMSLLKKAQLR
jgi:hypothetical protein